MPRGRKSTKKQDYSQYLNKALKRAKTKKSTKPTSKNPNWFESVQRDVQRRQSPSNLFLGAIIVVVLAVLAFNFFNKPKTSSPQTDSQATQSAQTADVSKESLPGKYTVKEGDTLYSIADHYYGNGYLFPKIAEENKMTDPDDLTPGTALQIPKIDQSLAQKAQPASGGIGGATSQTNWGPTISGDTYTVVEGDWLSTIAGRAYGDILAYQKIAQVNNIPNPDLIEPGQVLTIPR